VGPALGRSGEPSDGHHFLPPLVGSAARPKRSSPTVSGRPSTTGSVPSVATAGASVPYRATSRAGASTRSSATRGAAPTRGSRAVHERGALRPSRATTASTASSPIAR
jgi:hypothetical protein